MFKKLLFISLIFLLAGCSTTLNESWTNFRAYYNTYYNAKMNFEAGLDKIQSQETEINTDKPIRVHPEPLNAGDQEFEKAIEKGAQILRKFPDSKWIDETLELIGKSYYYRREYYSARQKFEEQYNVTESSELRQRAVIWKARVLLDLELYEEGILYLEEELEKLDEEWNRALLGEAQVLLAEHYVQQQNLEQVQVLLGEALNKLEKGPLKARTYFLYGQILEEQERFGEANFAYSNVTLNLPGFELLYWARKKQGETFRKMGNMEQALAIYASMRKDDKNLQRLSEIDYEIARTEEEKGNVKRAESIYKAILKDQNLIPSQSIRAKTYYRLGSIYQEHYNRYKLAASYFDSSSTFSTKAASSGQFAEESDARSLASAYGEYATIRNRIERIDSLLWLGSLPQSRFDSVIAEVREQKLQMQSRKEEKKDPSNVMTNLDANVRDSGRETSAGVYGFLNYRNSGMVADARNQFRAIWGSRALVDDWRRIEAVRNRSRDEVLSSRPDKSRSGIEQVSQSDSQIQIDISEVPFSKEQKNQKRMELASAKYELGNLFLLTLQMPDSAAHYFKSIVDEHPGHDLVPKALYSLFEVNWSSGDRTRAERWAERLRQEYPNSIYTDQVLKRLGVNRPGPEPDDPQDLQTRVQRILSKSDLPATGIAEELRTLALEHKRSKEAPGIYYEAIRQYVELAKEENPPVFASLPPDSDSTAVSTLQGSYRGAYWDSVRVLLEEYKSTFSEGRFTPKVNKLNEALSTGNRLSSESVRTCTESGATLRIKSGMDNFLKTVDYPKKVQNMNIAGKIVFEFILEPDGSVLSYRLLSEETTLGIEEAFENAIEEDLEFLPLQPDEPVEKLRCEVTFPVRL